MTNERSQRLANACAYTSPAGDPGLTVRELFAAMAMQGFAARKFDGGEPTAKHVAGWAVEQADALIAELSK